MLLAQMLGGPRVTVRLKDAPNTLKVMQVFISGCFR